MSDPRDHEKSKTEQQERHEFYFISSSVSKPKFLDKPNEDSFIENPDVMAYGIFDGAGGHAYADRASQIACDAVSRYVKYIPADADKQSAREILEAAYEHASEAIYNESKRLGVESMRTTATTLIMRKLDDRWRALYAHTGDSRLYLFRKGSLTCLTTDHGYLYQMQHYLAIHGIDHKKIAHEIDEVSDPRLVSDPNVDRFFKHRNVIVHSLGKESPPYIDIDAIDIEDGDLFILCSDGISDNLAHSQMEDLVNKYRNPAMLSMMLVENAKHVSVSYKKGEERTTRAKPDDMTAVVVAAHAR